MHFVSFLFTTALRKKASCFFFGVRPQVVDFGLQQGLSIFEAAGIARYFEDFKKCEDAAPGQKMPFVDGHCLTYSQTDQCKIAPNPHTGTIIASVERKETESDTTLPLLPSQRFFCRLVMYCI